MTHNNDVKGRSRNDEVNGGGRSNGRRDRASKMNDKADEIRHDNSRQLEQCQHKVTSKE